MNGERQRDGEREREKNQFVIISCHGLLLPKMTKIKMNGQMSEKNCLQSRWKFSSKMI